MKGFAFTNRFHHLYAFSEGCFANGSRNSWVASKQHALRVQLVERNDGKQKQMTASTLSSLATANFKLPLGIFQRVSTKCYYRSAFYSPRFLRTLEIRSKLTTARTDNEIKVTQTVAAAQFERTPNEANLFRFSPLANFPLSK